MTVTVPSSAITNPEVLIEKCKHRERSQMEKRSMSQQDSTHFFSNDPPPAVSAPASYRTERTVAAPDEVIHHTIVFDASDSGWLDLARRTVAWEYREFASPPLDPEVVFKLLSTDGYELYGRSKTLVAVTTHPMTGEPDLSGTVRLVLGRDGVDEHGLPALDAMRLMQVTPDWPHRQAGLPDRNTGELSRFVIPRQYRTAAMRAAGVPVFVEKALFETVIILAAQHSIEYVYAIMPPHVLSLLITIGDCPQEIPGAQVRAESPEVSRRVALFPGYWGKSPKLYRLLKGA